MDVLCSKCGLLVKTLNAHKCKWQFLVCTHCSREFNSKLSCTRHIITCEKNKHISSLQAFGNSSQSIIMENFQTLAVSSLKQSVSSSQSHLPFKKRIHLNIPPFSSTNIAEKGILMSYPKKYKLYNKEQLINV